MCVHGLSDCTHVFTSDSSWQFSHEISPGLGKTDDSDNKTPCFGGYSEHGHGSMESFTFMKTRLTIYLCASRRSTLT